MIWSWLSAFCLVVLVKSYWDCSFCLTSSYETWYSARSSLKTFLALFSIMKLSKVAVGDSLFWRATISSTYFSNSSFIFIASRGARALFALRLSAILPDWPSSAGLLRGGGLELCCRPFLLESCVLDRSPAMISSMSSTSVGYTLSTSALCYLFVIYLGSASASYCFSRSVGFRALPPSFFLDVDLFAWRSAFDWAPPLPLLPILFLSYIY